MAKHKLPQIIAPRDMDGIAAMMVAETEHMAKRKGERDTEFVKRIVAAYMNACGVAGVTPIRQAREASET